MHPAYMAHTLWPAWVRLNGGALDAHKTICRWSVSRFHIEISLLPCTAEIIHECSVGCVMTFRTLAPKRNMMMILETMIEYTELYYIYTRIMEIIDDNLPVGCLILVIGSWNLKSQQVWIPELVPRVNHCWWLFTQNDVITPCFKSFSKRHVVPGHRKSQPTSDPYNEAYTRTDWEPQSKYCKSTAHPSSC